jgi:hypothetical protein
MKQTAVEWLEQNMPNISKHIPLGVALEFTAKFQQAKEIEKEQLKDAYGDGINTHRTDFCNRDEYFDKVYRVGS